ncbi:MAG: immunoglobulin domain-containing protein, partial [Candidatus Kapaibacteriota bacterium]
VIPMTIYLPPTVQIHPKSRNTCVGDTVTLFATASGTSVQYQWFKDYKPLVGATSPVLAFTGIQGIESGLYHCRMTGLAPCDAVSTDTAVIYINRPIEVMKQPESKIVTKGSTVSFELTANANYVIQYQWKKNGVDVQDNMRISGAKSPNLVIRDIVLSDIAEYTCVATGPGNCGSVITQPATLDVLSVGIVKGPDDVTACEGSNVQLTVNAQSTPVGATLSYQWFKDGVKINGATSDKLDIPNVKSADAGAYNVEVSATGNVIGKAMAISAPGVLSVKPRLTITQMPIATQMECVGDTMSVSVIATGSNIRYQWYSNGTALVGDTNATFTRIADTVTAITENKYSCIITSDCGTDSTISVTFITMPNVAFVTTYPSEGVNVDFGKNFTFTANATGTNLRYKWFKDGVEIPGATDPSYILINAKRSDQGSKYRVEVTGDCGTITSKDINVTVIGPASIDDESTAWMLNSKPNPNNGDMTIQYAVTKPGMTTLFIRDAIGREIARFNAGIMDIGNYEHAFSLQNVSSGLYYVTLQQAGQTITRSMTIIK